ALPLGVDAYPPTPQLANFDAAQSIHSATNFVLTWNAFTGGNSNDIVVLAVEDGSGTDVFNTPDIFEPGMLDGTATSATITGGTLQVGTTYSGRLLFIKSGHRDTTSIPGALGATGYFKQTFFPVATLA